MVGDGTEKLEKYSRTAGSKKAAMNAAAEAIALSGHCVGFVRCPSRSTFAHNLSTAAVATSEDLIIGPQEWCGPLGGSLRVIYVPDSQRCVYLDTELFCKHVIHGGVYSTPRTLRRLWDLADPPGEPAENRLLGRSGMSEEPSQCWFGQASAPPPTEPL
jgi:hypothetical protein